MKAHILFFVALFLSAALCGGQGLADTLPPTYGDGTALVPPAPEADSGLTWQQVGGIVLLCSACGGGGAFLGRRTRSSVRLEQQPLKVELRRDFVSRTEFDNFCARNSKDLNALRASMEKAATREDLDNLRTQNNKELRDLHARVDNIAPAVAEVRGELKRIASTQETILRLLLNGKQTA